MFHARPVIAVKVTDNPGGNQATQETNLKFYEDKTNSIINYQIPILHRTIYEPQKYLYLGMYLFRRPKSKEEYRKCI